MKNMISMILQRGFRCIDCGSEFYEPEILKVGEIDYLSVCPECNSVNIEEVNENGEYGDL